MGAGCSVGTNQRHGSKFRSRGFNSEKGGQLGSEKTERQARFNGGFTSLGKTMRKLARMEGPP